MALWHIINQYVALWHIINQYVALWHIINQYVALWHIINQYQHQAGTTLDGPVIYFTILHGALYHGISWTPGIGKLL